METTPAAVPSLLHELSTPLTVLISASDLLRNRVPDSIEPVINRLGETSRLFGRDVVTLRAHLEDRIDLRSSREAAVQIQRLAAGWRRHESDLADSVAAIQAARIHLDDPLLDRILNQNLWNGLSELRRNLDRLEAIRPEDLLLPGSG